MQRSCKNKKKTLRNKRERETMNAPTRKRESGEKVSSNENSNQPCVMSDNTIMVSFKRNL